MAAVRFFIATRRLIGLLAPYFFAGVFVSSCNLSDDSIRGYFGTGSEDTTLATILSLNLTTEGNTYVDLSWSLSSGLSPEGYTIAYNASTTAPSDCSTADAIISSSSITGTTHRIDNLNPNTEYSFLVCALNEDSSITSSKSTSAYTLAQVGSGAESLSLVALDVNTAETKAYATDSYLLGVVEVDLSNGDRTLISNQFNGTGTNFSQIQGIAVNAAETIAYVIDADLPAVIAVDLATGNRVVISDGSTGSGTSFLSPWNLVLSADETKAYVVDSGYDGLFSVDIATGNRTVLSKSGVQGTGTSFSSPRDVTVNAAETTAYVIEDFAGLRGVVEVDLASGNRTIISDNSTGTGTIYLLPQAIALNSSENQILAADQPRLMWADIATGNRTSISAGAGVSLSLADMHLNSSDSYAWGINNQTAIIELDLSTGNRRVVSDSSAGRGKRFAIPDALAINTAGDHLYVLDGQFSTLTEVDVSSGDRTYASKSSTGTGTSLSSYYNLSVNSSLSNTPTPQTPVLMPF